MKLKGLKEEFQDSREGMQQVGAVSLNDYDNTGLTVWKSCTLRPSVASEVNCSPGCAISVMMLMGTRSKQEAANFYLLHT